MRKQSSNTNNSQLRTPQYFSTMKHEKDVKAMEQKALMVSMSRGQVFKPCFSSSSPKLTPTSQSPAVSLMVSRSPASPAVSPRLSRARYQTATQRTRQFAPPAYSTRCRRNTRTRCGTHPQRT
jgi:hypothetical protein